ncbi:hypothetical protein PENTCL1PPCAC_25373, partial [Pristionchus entomophagus]
FLQKFIADLPIELLRKIFEPLSVQDRLSVRLTCSALEEVIATSNLAGERMELQYNYESTMFRVMLDRFELFGCTIGTVSQRTLQWRMRMAGKIRVQWLIIRTVRLIDLRVVNEFLDACIFDKLTVHISHRGLCTRIYDLIAKANKDVELYIRYIMPTQKQFMAFSRPVTFHFFRKWKPVKDEHFLNVLRMGHSIVSKDSAVFIKLRSEETLVEAIKIVSAANVAQTLHIDCIDSDSLQRLIRLTNAKKIEPLKHYHIHHTYVYLRARIIQNPPGYGDLRVSSLAYDRQQK